MSEINLQPILLGPIQRRIEPTKIVLWIATSVKTIDIEVLLFKLKLSLDKTWEEENFYNSSMSKESKCTEIQFGANLFITLIEIFPISGDLFPVNTIIGYDLIITFEKDVWDSSIQKHISIFSFKEYMGINIDNYTFSDLPYPIIVIPDLQKVETNIIYGSCRRAGYKNRLGGGDAVSAATAKMEQVFENYRKGIYKNSLSHALFLMGDQIYADDLKEGEFEYVRELALTLMGYKEEILVYQSISEPTSVRL